MKTLASYASSPFNVGFDSLFDEFNSIIKGNLQTYPPHNVVRIDENRYRIELALAGFTKDEVKIQSEDGVLSISGEKEEKDSSDVYIHRGIAARSFSRTFKLSQWIEVESAKWQDGILLVYLVKNIPEAKKPKTVTIE